MKNKFFTLTLIVSLFFSQVLFAFEKKAENFINDTTNNAKKIILDKNLDKVDKKKQLEKLALDSVDVEGLAKYTLGEERKKINEKQLQEFVDTFKVFFTKNLSSKLTDYSDQKVQITGSKKISDNYVLVNSKIISEKDKQEIIVEWIVFIINNKLVSRDLVVEGLSLARTQREEFASIVANKGFAGLIQNLQEYINKN